MPIERSRSRGAVDAVLHQPVPQLAQPPEIRPRLLRIVGPGRQQHQAAEPRGGHSAAARAIARPRRAGAEFGRLAGEVDLDDSSSGAPPASAAAASSRRTRSTESIAWMAANAGAAFFTLFDCRWPIRCHLTLISAVSPIFCRPSWTLFSPKSRCPAA